ncbi:MAG: hypothetical protein R2788_23525 [Saprospiraceae bacterium]
MTRHLFFLFLLAFGLSCKKSDDPITVEPVPPFTPPIIVEDCQDADGFPEIPGWKHREIAISNGPNFDVRIYFLNQTVGFLYDTNGNLLRTTNSGENWENVLIQSQQYNQHLFFLNGQQGFLSVKDSPASNSFTGALLKTTDGGVTWNRHSYQPAGRLQSIFFVDELHGFAHVIRSSPTSFSTSSFARTEDGGATWQDIAGVIPAFNYYQSFQIFPDGFGYIAGTSGRVFITVDNGEDWEVIHTGLSSVEQVQFLDKMNGYASSFEGFYKTMDGGKTWTQISQNYAPYFHFFSPQSGFTLQSNGNLITNDVVSECFNFALTEDGGETWIESKPLSYQYNTPFFFPNDQIGFLFSGYNANKLLILEKE